MGAHLGTTTRGTLGSMEMVSMKKRNVMVAGAVVGASLGWLGVTASGCSNTNDDCETNPLACPPSATSSGQGGSGASGGAGSTSSTGGDGGSGGADGCTSDSACTSATAAKCDVGTGTCVACDASPQCEGVNAGATEVCDGGACVGCTAEEGCTASQTCNLLTQTCEDVAPLSLDTCEACTNDAQCASGHRCVPMDFPVGTAHGHYCLEAADPTCVVNPYRVAISVSSINGEPATNYCGIDEERATCEAVKALLGDWQCSGTDGMCSPDGVMPEVAVPGALCREVDLTPDRCTYACATASRCPDSLTCDDGPQNSGPPNWCGG